MRMSHVIDTLVTLTYGLNTAQQVNMMTLIKPESTFLKKGKSWMDFKHTRLYSTWRCLVYF